jgi:hypothetical protein
MWCRRWRVVNVIEAWTLQDVVLSVVTEGRLMIVGVGFRRTLVVDS